MKIYESYRVLCLYILKDLFIDLKVNVTEREGEKHRELFHLLVHFPRSSNGLAPTRQKAGARNFICMAGAQALRPSFVAFPGHCWRAGLQVEQQLGLKLEAIWDVGAADNTCLLGAKERFSLIFNIIFSS